MHFEWDESKRLSNLTKHGLDFIDADLLFGALRLVAAARSVGDEPRWLAIGMLRGLTVTVIFTRRSETICIISLQRARRDETTRYQQIFG